MDEQEVRKIAEAAGKAAVDEMRRQYDMERERHAEHHRFVDEAMQMIARINEIKWGVVKLVVTGLVLAIFALLGWRINQ